MTIYLTKRQVNSLHSQELTLLRTKVQSLLLIIAARPDHINRQKVNELLSLLNVVISKKNAKTL